MPAPGCAIRTWPYCARPSGRRGASSFILLPPGLSFGRAGIVVRANVADHTNRLNFDLDPGPGEIRHGDEGAAGIVPVLEEVLAHFHELVAIAGFLDEDRHGDDIVQAAASALQDAVDLSKHLFDLSFEIIGDVVALAVFRRSLASDPDRDSARRYDSWGKCTRQLERRLLHVLGSLCYSCEQHHERHATIRFIRNPRR